MNANDKVAPDLGTDTPVEPRVRIRQAAGETPDVDAHSDDHQHDVDRRGDVDHGADNNPGVAHDSALANAAGTPKATDGPPTSPETATSSVVADEAALSRLAALSPFEYDRVRKNEAETLGVRTGTLDTLVRQARGGSETASLAGRDILFNAIEPWPEPIDGAALLAELADSAQRYLVLPEHADTVLALWVLFTHTIEAADAAPILAIVSPEARCGKSTVVDWLTRLVRNPLPTVNVSTAALFRSIEKWQPTLLIDEFDTFLKVNDEVRGVLNSGHTRGSAFVIRTVGDEHEPRQFSTWGAKAIALIGKMPNTLADRSIAIEMRRKMPGEHVQKLRGEVKRRHLEGLSRRCLRFAIDALPALRQADPKIPDGLNDRAADSWAPLLAIADVAGGEWPAFARTAASVVSGATPDGDSLNVELLRDVRAAFTARDQDRLASVELADALAADPERPWSEFNRGKAITVRQLARRLHPFGILSGTVRLQSGRTLKGYKLEDFADAFARYIPPEVPSQRHTQELTPVVTDKSNVTDEACDGSLLTSETSAGAVRDVVTDQSSSISSATSPDESPETTEASGWSLRI